MDLKAKKSFSSQHVGNVEPGQTLYDVPGHLAVHFVENDLCEFVGGGKKPGAPLVNGPGQPSLSSQAGQASQSNSVNTSDSDSSKASAESSQSTAATNASQPVTASTASTGDSGGSTTKKRQSKPRKSRATGGRQKPTA